MAKSRAFARVRFGVPLPLGWPKSRPPLRRHNISHHPRKKTTQKKNRIWNKVHIQTSFNALEQSDDLMVSDRNGMKASSGGGRHLETLRGRAGGGSGRSGRSAGSGVGGVGAVAFRIQFRVKRGETRFQFIEIERPSTTSEKIAHRGLAPPLGSWKKRKWMVEMREKTGEKERKRGENGWRT